MGVDCDATLCYGIIIPEDYEPETYQEEKSIYKLSSILEKKYGCECVVFGYCGDEELVVLTIAKSKIDAWFGKIKEVPDLKVEDNWETTLRLACTFANIPWQEPKWYFGSCLC
jgi:hypothetical protein